MSDQKESVIDRIEQQSTEIFAQKNMAQAAAQLGVQAPVKPDPGAQPIVPAPPDPDDLEIDGKKIEMPPEIKSEEGKKGWGTWKKLAKGKIDALSTELTEFKKKMEDAPKAQVKPYEDKIAALQAERQELSEQLSQVALERTPEFRRHYIDKVEREIAKARDVVGPEMADRVHAVLTMPESKHKREQLNALYADLDESQKIDIGTIRKAVSDTMQERDHELANSKANIELRDKAYKERETIAQTQAREKYESTFNSTLADARKELALLQNKDGDDAWNKRIEQDLADAKDLFTTADPKRRAGAAIMAATHRTALAQLEVAQAEIASLKKHIETSRVKTPEVKGGGIVLGGNPVVLPGGKPESLAERIARRGGEEGFVK